MQPGPGGAERLLKDMIELCGLVLGVQSVFERHDRAMRPGPGGAKRHLKAMGELCEKGTPRFQWMSFLPEKSMKCNGQASGSLLSTPLGRAFCHFVAGRYCVTPLEYAK